MMEYPTYMKNKNCYYVDPRVARTKLTDQATEEDVDSYVSHYSRTLEIPTKVIYKKIYEDVLEYQQNKDRYTFETNEFGERHLVAIDGKDITPPELKATGHAAMEYFLKRLASKGGFLDD